MLSAVVLGREDAVGLARCLAAIAEGVPADLVVDAACLLGTAEGEEADVADAAGAAVVPRRRDMRAALAAALAAAPRGRAVLVVDARCRPAPGWSAAGGVVRAVSVAAAGAGGGGNAALRVAAFDGPGRVRATRWSALAGRFGAGASTAVRTLGRLDAYVAARADMEALTGVREGPRRPRLRIERIADVALLPTA